VKHIDKPTGVPPAGAPAWGSDVAAAMLRALGIKYVALNPGASYRGLHDSLVNYLGNQSPQMLLCLHEDHVVSIAHGYAKATDEAMGAVLHSNVGLMHGLMGVFNAWCDRAPMMILGATGPIAPEKRRPWIDWIHTAKDQGALLRDFTKWDDEPRSPEGIVEGMLRGWQLTTTEPCAPVYICLDAGLQEDPLAKPVHIPDVARFKAPPPPGASPETVERIADLLVGAKKPFIFMGNGSRSRESWDLRVKLAELTGATCFTSQKTRAAFPSDHPLHPVQPFSNLPAQAKELLAGADVIVSLDWIDFNGTLQQLQRPTAEISAKIVHVSLDAALHKGWSMDFFGLPPVDVPVQASTDVFVRQLVPVLEKKLGGKPRWTGTNRVQPRPAEYGPNAAKQIDPKDLEVALAKAQAKANGKIVLAHITIGWSGTVYPWRDPLDYLGHDGGGGLAAGPGHTIGAALALKDSGRAVVGVIGDGDFMQGASALWTAAHYSIPALFIVANNRSNFNDELHQETVAKVRNRPVENRWVGQRIDEPAIDLAGLARAQGVEAEGPIETIPDLEKAIERGLAAIAAGKPYLIDAHVQPGYANVPLARGK
jgi:thiamine pyrophosphate-dependent acetolactate synthase large subunit-like protein